MGRVRADVLLVSRGLFTSREQARAAVLAGDVRAAGAPVTKAGELLSEDVELDVAARPRYVSRGGTKLEAALTGFGVDPCGARCLDVGASTGGFTDCLLQHGAASVVAVDVGYGQLAWALRNDPRVTVRERTNIREADPLALGGPFDIVTIDVSFVGLLKVLPVAVAGLAPEGNLLALIKPQFEAGKGRVGKRGVVRDAEVHRDVLAEVLTGAEALGLTVRGLTWSPVKGPEGNIEFWAWLAPAGVPAEVDIPVVVDAAHRELGE